MAFKKGVKPKGELMIPQPAKKEPETFPARKTTVEGVRLIGEKHQAAMAAELNAFLQAAGEEEGRAIQDGWRFALDKNQWWKPE